MGLIDVGEWVLTQLERNATFQTHASIYRLGLESQEALNASVSTWRPWSSNSKRSGPPWRRSVSASKRSGTLWLGTSGPRSTGAAAPGVAREPRRPGRPAR